MEKKEKLEYIVVHYGKLMHREAESVLNDYHEAEDACQESFLKLYNVIDKLEDPESVSFKSYCVKTARNTAIDMARKKAKQIPAEFSVSEENDTQTYDHYPSDTEDMIKDIEDLPEKYRNIIQMRCFDEMSARNTAEILDSNVATVNSQLLRARKLLKDKWVSIACLALVCMLILSPFFYNNIIAPKVNYSTIIQDGNAELKMIQEEAAGAAEDAETNSVLFDESETELSDLPLYDELDELALKEVKGASAENITERKLTEEGENNFCYEVIVVFENKTHTIRLSVTGELISHTVSE